MLPSDVTTGLLIVGALIGAQAVLHVIALFWIARTLARLIPRRPKPVTTWTVRCEIVPKQDVSTEFAATQPPSSDRPLTESHL